MVNNGIKNKDIDIFKNKIRSVDILLIDDIQFFLGKKGVSEELFHTINYFLNNSKAVVLASDQKPQDLLGFPERLVSRILNGLVTDIEKPDKKIFSEVLNQNLIIYDSKELFEILNEVKEIFNFNLKNISKKEFSSNSSNIIKNSIILTLTKINTDQKQIFGIF